MPCFVSQMLKQCNLKLNQIDILTLNRNLDNVYVFYLFKKDYRLI